jgi:hypothetical protein
MVSRRGCSGVLRTNGTYAGSSWGIPTWKVSGLAYSETGMQGTGRAYRAKRGISTMSSVRDPCPEKLGPRISVGTEWT